MGLGVGNKGAGRETRSDFIENTKGVCVSRCYFKTRPLVLKIRGALWSSGMYICSLSSTVSLHKPTAMCYYQPTDESPSFLSHLWPQRFNCNGLRAVLFQEYHVCNHHSTQTHFFPPFILLFCLFHVDFSFRFHLTLSHFASVRRPLSLHQRLSLFLLNLSLFPPHIPEHGTLLASLLYSLRTHSEKALIVQLSL